MFNRSYEPFQNCHTLTEFIPCYFDITLTYFSISLFYISLCLLLFFLLLIRLKKFNYRSFSIILNAQFSIIFSSLYKSFYVYRFVLQYRFRCNFINLSFSCKNRFRITFYIVCCCYCNRVVHFQEIISRIYVRFKFCDSLLIITIICIFIYDFYEKEINILSIIDYL